MRWGWTAGWAVAVMLMATRAQAQSPPDLQTRVDEAAACYARFDYDCVIDLLGRLDVAAAAEVHPRSLVELAVRLVAVSFVVRDVPERGRALFFELLGVYPDYRLSGEELAPRFYRVFDEARAMRLAASRASPLPGEARSAAVRIGAAEAGREVSSGVVAWARALALTAPVGGSEPVEARAPGLELALGPAAERLFGADADSYADALGLSGRVATGRLVPVTLELGVDWFRHDVEAHDLVADVSVLTVLTFSGAVLYPWRFGRLTVSLGGGAGYTAFGFDSPFDRGGLALDALGRLQLALGAGFGLELEARWRTVLATGRDGETVASSPLLLGLRLAFGWPGP